MSRQRILSNNTNKRRFFGTRAFPLKTFGPVSSASVPKTRLTNQRAISCLCVEFVTLLAAMKIGYCRVSTSDQSTEPQEDELRRAGCEKIFRDVASGARASRPGLDELLAHARKGDLIVVVRLDRLGHNLRDLLETVRTLERGGRGFKSLAENIDSTTAGGKRIFHIFASLAEFERALIRERTLAGLAAARARGRVGGRPKNTDTRKQAMAMSLLADPANSVTAVCRLLKVSRSTAYRLARAGAAAAKTAKKASVAKPATKASSRAGKKGKAATKPQAATRTNKKTVSPTQQPSARRKAKTK